MNKMKSVKALFPALLLVNIFFLFFCGQQIAAQTDQAALFKQIPLWLKQYRVPAVGVAVIRDGKVEWAEVFGERAPGSKATRDTIFNTAAPTYAKPRPSREKPSTHPLALRPGSCKN